MSVTGRSETASHATGEVAARLLDTEFVRVVAAATGDAVGAAGLLATALDSRSVPFQTSVVGLPDRAESGTDADLTIALGRPATTADVAIQRGAAAAADEIARELGGGDPVLALAGTIAAGRQPDSDLLARAADRGIERRPGVAIPDVALADGLAHSTLLSAPFSGDPEATRDALAGLDLPDRPGDDALGLPDRPGDDALGRVASFVALTIAGDDAATARGAAAIERFLHPLEGGPLGTVGGYADVLDVAARERPGVALLLALGQAERTAALDAWRDHACRAHAAVRDASTGRYNGLFVARCGDGPREESVPVGTVARLLCAYRSPEPIVLAVADGVAEARAVSADLESDREEDDRPSIGDAIRDATERVGGRAAGTATRGRATYDVSPTEFVGAFREVV
jgi:hypothetical protein